MAQALLDEMERQTSVKHQQYTLTIALQVTLVGALAGQELHDTFTPQLVFRADELELQVMRDDQRGTDPLAPTLAGLLKHQRSEPNTIGVLGLALGVVPARWLALMLAVLAIAGAVIVARKLTLAKLGDEPERIRVRYGPLLVAVHDSELAINDRVVLERDIARAQDRPGAVFFGASALRLQRGLTLAGGPLLVAVHDSELAINDRVVEVASFDDLVRLAERDERMILYERSGAVHHYVVQIAGVNYHYGAVQVAGAHAIAAEERRP